jgi:hypothetical protein
MYKATTVKSSAPGAISARVTLAFAMGIEACILHRILLGD